MGEFAHDNRATGLVGFQRELVLANERGDISLGLRARLIVLAARLASLPPQGERAASI